MTSLAASPARGHAHTWFAWTPSCGRPGVSAPGHRQPRAGRPLENAKVQQVQMQMRMRTETGLNREYACREAGPASSVQRLAPSGTPGPSRVARIVRSKRAAMCAVAPALAPGQRQQALAGGAAIGKSSNSCAVCRFGPPGLVHYLGWRPANEKAVVRTYAR
eukprot:CAMPEP_0175191688 /NCGR_PEP_ID=MMETSP0093-20121207/5070_1 /TAXON_ID=311494 /ORGANISM="Alexandrium monilatum, Strain CCMP3105" /LENGTH=161 /DNA_ID=CAMNT_0016484517 /DNA_START=164 /DNA_END=646 /DNA_ORIENTATION=+